MNYQCCDQLRRSAVLASSLNGIDYLEVIDREAASEAWRQRVLKLHFLKDISALGFGKDNLVIAGGTRIQDIKVLVATSGTGTEANILTVQVNQPGDYSTYTLSLVEGSLSTEVPAGIDPCLASVDFSFKVECPSDFDCAAQNACEEESSDEPDINYLTKDYDSFRRLLLDRLSIQVPGWTQRNPADLGVVLVEALAYTADQLSYQQDAIATEAYLNTARRRISVRRHARLMDYYLSDGCNARTWVHLQVSTDLLPLAPATQVLDPGTRLFTSIARQDTRIADDPDIYNQADVVFETAQEVTALYEQHNLLQFYTWSDQNCCLPKGATSATLQGHLANLLPGTVLIIEEVIDPGTGKAADADPAHRHAVVLTKVTHTAADGSNLVDPVPSVPVEITKISWHEDDALPFPVCVSAETEAGYLENISVLRGNIVLADHGMTVGAEVLGPVPEAVLFALPESAGEHCSPLTKKPIPPRFRPLLQKAPLTQAAPEYALHDSAVSAMAWSLRDVKPVIRLQSTLGDDQGSWSAQRDLLNSAAAAEDFVVEIESDGSTMLRFGDDVHGKRPEAGTVFTATYRVGNGLQGNIGADALTHIICAYPEITAVRNPLAAGGGLDPETIKEARQRIPIAYRKQQRAVTEADYAEITERKSGIQKAAARFRWTGSWYTAFVTADREQEMTFTDDYAEELKDYLEPYRMAGQDINIHQPQYVPLEIAMHVCVSSDYFRSEVRQELLEVLGSKNLRNNRSGFFHPDNFTFGQSVYLSRLYAVAQSVSGVTSVSITTFQRQGVDETGSLAQGEIEIGNFEIARLDNDPNYPENGVLILTLGGGK